MATETTRFNVSSYDGGKSGGKKSEYGYNQVFKQIGGGECHYDSTPGGERLFVMHPRGGFTEVNWRGDEIKMTIGDCKNYNKSGLTTTTDENSDCMSCGHSRTLGGGAVVNETSGDVHVAFGGDVGVSGMKNVNIRAKQMLVTSDNAINIRAPSIHVKADNSMMLEAKGTVFIKGGKVDINGSSSGSFTSQSGFPNKGGGSGLTS